MGKNYDDLMEQMQNIHMRLSVRAEKAGESSPTALLPETLEELRAALEELQVAEEELRQQNEELHAAHLAVTAQRERYQELFELAPDGYLVTDAQGIIAEANMAATVMLGLSARYAAGKPLANYVAEGERVEFRRRLLRLRESGAQPTHFTVTLVSRAGETTPVDMSVVRTAAGAGQTQSALRWIARDATERLEAEQARLALAEEQAALHRAYEREHRIAETLQRSLLRAGPEKEFAHLEVATFYEAALAEAQVGGDFYDVFTVGDGKVALLVGDVSGKGLYAAACTAEIKYALRAFLRECLMPDEALNRLNNFMCDARRQNDWGDDIFATMAAVVLDPATGQAWTALAGAEPLLVVRASGAIEEIDAPGMLLGIDMGRHYMQNALTLAPGDTLLMTTDGVTEARQGSQFLGQEGLRRLAEETRHAPTPQAMGESILARVHQFVSASAGGSLHDDACVLIARRTGD